LLGEDVDGKPKELPGLMSLTRTVPAALPSLFHNSRPFTPSSATKNSVPPTAVRYPGYEPELAGLMSLTRTVPAALPSLFHSSTPFTQSLAEKYSARRTAVLLLGEEVDGKP